MSEDTELIGKTVSYGCGVVVLIIFLIAIFIMVALFASL